jgi:cupin 2 domain-containing protein
VRVGVGTYRSGRLSDPISAPRWGETTETMATMAGVRIEEILSGALEAPISYRQDHDEWTVVLAGGAVIEVDSEPVSLSVGEWILLPRGVSHRLVSTVPGTQWLVVRGWSS